MELAFATGVAIALVAIVSLLIRRMTALQAEIARQQADLRMRETFQALAADALKDNRASFLDLAKTSFERYQQPIAETLGKVDQRLREVERERVAAYSKLTEQIVALGSATHT